MVTDVQRRKRALFVRNDYFLLADVLTKLRPCQFFRGSESPNAGFKRSAWVGAGASVRKEFKLPYTLLKITYKLICNEKLQIVV